MSEAASSPPVLSRNLIKHYSLSANQSGTYSIPHHALTHPNSRVSGATRLNAGTSNSSPTSRLSLKNASHITAKNVMFYRSGDTNFQSFKVAVTKRNFRTFDALLENLSEKVPLPFGVRTISTPNGTHGISRLDELEDGKAYICSDRKTVKPLDLNMIRKSKPPWFISKPKTRTRRLAALVRRSNQTSQDSSIPPRYLQVKTPKKVVIVKNGDPTFRHSILLSRRTPQSFEQIMEDVAEIFRIKQYKMYTCEGRKVESLQELFLDGNVFVLAGKEAFIPLEYRIRRNAIYSKSGSSEENSAKVESDRMPKELKKTKGRWRVTVTTSELPAAGTDSKVAMIVYGSKGNSGPISMTYNNSSGNSTVVNKDRSKKLFMSGNEDEFVVNVGFIGDIRKIRIYHDNSGKTSPGWLCEEVILYDLTTSETITFPFNRWMSRDEDDGEICRELPVVANEETSLPVFRYIVSVITGNLWNAGTEANVYITLYGNLGDSGARLLQVSGKPKPLHKGTTDVFRFEAVNLGTLQRLVVGHDGIGIGSGWFLEKVVVKEDRVGSDEYVFSCDRWLDEGEDDHKIVRELFAEQKLPANSRQRNNAEKAKEMELWEQEKWKFQKGNRIMLISKATGRAIRTKPDGSVDGLGDISHPFDLVKIKESDLGVYEVIRRRGCVRVFANDQTPSFHLAVDQNRLLGQGKGGTFCEFMVKVQPDRSVMLESCRYSGHYVSIDPSGRPSDTRGHPNTAGRLFNVYVKGCFRHNSIVLLNTSFTQALVVTGVGDVVGTGKRGDVSGESKINVKSPGFVQTPQYATFRVIKVAEGVRMFQCEKHPRRYLRIKDGQCDGLGIGDVYCHFKVQKYKQSSYVTLQSMKHRGVFIGLSSNGKARPTVDTGDSNTQFFPEVIKFGDKKKGFAKPWKTPEPSFLVPDDSEDRKKKEKNSPLHKSADSSIKNKQSQQVTTIQTREDSNPGPDEGDYRIYVTSGNSGTKEVVMLAAYGDKGQSGNITLGKGSEGGVFQIGQTDEFQANLSAIGRLFKIRIGVEEASANCDWRLKQVKMKDMTSNEIFRFKFNRWISRNKDDGDTLRELPVVIEGTDGELTMHRYYVQVKTGKGSTSFSGKKSPVIYMCIHGENGDTGRRLLQKRSCSKNHVSGENSRKLFMPNQTDVFELEGVSLGVLSKCSLSCPTSLHASSKMTSTTSYPAWFCEEIVIRESEGSATEYVFSCKKWLGLKKAGSHAQINLSLTTIREVKTTSSDEADFKEGDWKVCVTTGSEQGSGTSASVIFYACGLDGSNSGAVLLGKGADGLFTPEVTEKFKVNLSEVNDLYKIRIGHDGSGSDPGWYVESIKLMDLHNDISHTLPVKKWLAADRENYQLFTEIPIPRPGVETIPVVKYQIHVYTGSILGSDTDANVHLCLYGTKGDSGKRPLIKSLKNDIRFQESQVDIFELEAVSLGELNKIKIGHDGVGHGNGWFLHKVVVKESATSKENVFFCNRWLDDGQDDGKIEREISVELAAKHILTRPASISNQSTPMITRSWQNVLNLNSLRRSVTSISSDDNRKSTSTSDSKSSEIKKKRFKRGNRMVSKRVLPRPSREKKMMKNRETQVSDIDSPSVSFTPTSPRRQIVLEQYDFQDAKTSVTPGLWSGNDVDYNNAIISPFTYDFLPNIDLNTSPARKVITPTTHQVYPQNSGSSDRSSLEIDFDGKVRKRRSTPEMLHYVISKIPTMYIPYKKATAHIGTSMTPPMPNNTHHMLATQGNLKPHSVSPRVRSVVWTIRGDALRKTNARARSLSPTIIHDAAAQDKTSDGEYRVLVTTGAQSTLKPCPVDAKVTIVVYGEEGRTGEILLQPVGRESRMKRKQSRSMSQGGMRDTISTLDCFKPNQTDEFKIDIPEIGQIYKVRMSYNYTSQWTSWFLEKLVLEEMITKRQLMFPCGRWLSSNDDDQETVREIAVVKDGQETLKTILYHVTIYTGDRHGAGTDANVHILLRGERGDSGRRYFKATSSDVPNFQRSCVDMFIIEAVDLGRIVEVVVGHDGEGYGAGWYVEKITARAGEFAPFEWVFPCHTWLDDHVGDCKVSRRLPALGVMMLDTQEEELENLGTPSSREAGKEGIWDINVLISEIEMKWINRIHLTGTFYGTNGLRKTDMISLGEWSTGGRKQMKLQTDLGSIGEIYKLRVEIPDYGEPVSLLLASVTMQNIHTKEQIQFAFHRHLRTGSGSTVKELPALKLHKNPPKMTRYVVDVSIAPVKADLAPEGKLRLKLIGDAGDSGFRSLITGMQAFHATEHKEGYVFNLDAVDLGRLTTAVIAYESEGKDKSRGWKVQNLSIKIEDPPSSSAIVSLDSFIYKAEVENTFKTTPSIERVEKEYILTEELVDDTRSYSPKSAAYLKEGTLKAVQKASEGSWNLTLVYSENFNMEGDGSDDILMIQDLEKYKVMVQVFGTRNCSDSFLLSSLNPKRSKYMRGTSEMKQIKTNLSLGSDMGSVYLLRLSCQKWNPNLVKIKLKDVHTKQEFISHVSEAQHKKIENSISNGIGTHLDVPLIRPDVPPLEHHKYKLAIRTGDLPAAGTDSNIWINLFGTHGDTGLRKIKPCDWDGFARASIESFTIETVDVGEPRRISINHDGAGLGDGWFLEDINVHEERNEKRTDFVFQCNKWLDDGVDEKVTQKDIYLTGVKFHYPTNYLRTTKGCWQCRLKAKILNEDDNDMPLIAKIAFYLRRESQPVFKLCRFEGSEVEFDINFPEDDEEGKSSQVIQEASSLDDGFYKIRVEVIHDEEKGLTRDWPFEELLMADMDSREKLHFVFDDCAVWEGSNRDIVRELPVMRVRRQPLKLYDYYIMFFTASDSVAHSNHNLKVEVLLTGENGDSGWRQLREAPKTNSNAILQPGKMEMLFTEAVDLGATIKSVSVRVADTNVRWKLDCVKVKKGFFSKEEFIFDCGRWIEGSGGKAKEQVVKLDLTNTVLSPYPPPSRGRISDDMAVETYEIHSVWDVNVVSDAAETNGVIGRKKFLPSLAMKLYGTRESSDLQLIDKMSSSKGRSTANFEIKPDKSLRELYKVGIGIEGFNNSKQSISVKLKSITLLKLTIRNTKTKEYYSFRPGVVVYENKSSSAAAGDNKEGNDSGVNWIELVPERPKQVESKYPKVIDYTITIQTGDQEEAGTAANVYIILHGNHEGYPMDGGKRWLLSNAKEGKFVRGVESQFNVKGVDLGDVKQVTVGHDGNDATMGWFLESIKVKPSNSMKTFVFPCGKWLANLEDDTFVERTLDVDHVVSPETIPKRPISTQGIFSDPEDDHYGGSRVQTTETLHGRPSSIKKDEKPAK